MATQASDPAAAALPNAEPTDSEQVLRCLEAARKLWQEGQLREAVRTLQRGAEAAEEDGNDLRALSLARCAADLSAQIGSAASVPPPPPEGDVPMPPPLPVEAAASPAPPSVAEPAGPPSEAGPPVSVEPPTESMPAPLPSSPLATPAAPSVRPVQPSTASRRSTQPGAQPSKRLVPSAGPAAESHAAPPKSATTNGSAALPGAGTAREIRVSVRRSNVDEELYVVRPLRPGSKLPYGAEEAVLVFRDADAPGKQH